MPLLQRETRERVLVLTLDRPDKLNALNGALRAELMGALADAAADDAVGAIVITGAGKAFAAGADVDEMAARTLDEQRAFITPPHIYDAVRHHPKPVIAAVNGLALGAGCELAMACDVRVAGERAKFGQPEIKLGIIPGGGGTQRLVRLVGRGRAFRMVTTGDFIDAATAEAWGLADEVVPQDAVVDRAVELAAAMAAMSPVALKLVKEAVNAAEDLPGPQGLAREVDLFCLAFQSADAKEGIAAFREKRPPTWAGK